MAEVTCVDGSVLTVRPVPCLGRDGVPYEVTLRLLRDGAPFGEVGERCGFFLATVAARLREAGGGFPPDELRAAVAPEVRRLLPRDRELLAFQARDPDDLATAGELRVWLRDERRFAGGRWVRRELAVLDAWGEAGTGVRAVLEAPALLSLLDALLAECADVGAAY